MSDRHFTMSTHAWRSRALFWAAVFSSSFACQVKVSHLDETFHWTCHQCRSKEDCCDAIDVNWERGVCPVASLPSMEGVFSYFEIVPPTRTATDNDGQNPFRDGTAIAKMMSSLSLVGGMHRKLAIDVDVASHFGSTTLLLFLTEDVFVDIEHLFEGDCVGHGNARCRVGEVHSTGLIDMEQPAFLSPQHVVAVDIEWDNVPADGGLTLQVLIHLRYPTPVVGGGNREIRLPAPVLVSSPNMQAPLVATVALGNEGDYGIVSLVTMVVQILGTVVLLRGIGHAFPNIA